MKTSTYNVNVNVNSGRQIPTASRLEKVVTLFQPVRKHDELAPWEYVRLMGKSMSAFSGKYFAARIIYGRNKLLKIGLMAI